MEELLAYFNSIVPLSPAFKDHFIGVLKIKTIAKKDFLLKRGNVSSTMNFIANGLLRCFYVKDDKEISSWFMKEGDLAVSVQSYFNQSPSFEYIQAIEDTIIVYVTYEEQKHIYNTFPEANYIGRVLTEHYYCQSEQRLHSIRMQKAAERYKFMLDNYPELIQRVPSKYLASYLSISEETLSRIRSRKIIY